MAAHLPIKAVNDLSGNNSLKTHWCGLEVANALPSNYGKCGGPTKREQEEG